MKLFLDSHRSHRKQPSLQLSYMVSELQGQGTRANQEDSYAFVNAQDVEAIRENGLLAILADGMGGLKNGKEASTLAIQSISQSFRQWDYTQPLGEQLKQAAAQANTAVNQALQGDGGSTLIVCLIYQQTLYWASVGDSFCFLKRENQLVLLNQLHTYRTQLYMDQIQAGMLDITDADQDPDGHRLSSFIGGDCLEEVSYSVRGLELQENDVLMLCSDGVGGVIERDILSGYLSGSPVEACAQIQEDIIQQNRRHQDNFTALVIQCVC